MEPGLTAALVFSLIGLISSLAYLLKRIKKFDSLCCKVKCGTPEAITREHSVKETTSDV